MPFCTWIMIGYFASIPKELDGPPSSTALVVQTLTRIFIPVALPGLIAANHLQPFTVSWAQFLYPLVFTTSTTTGAAGRHHNTLIKGDVFNWGQIMTGALLGAALRSHLRLPDGLLHRRPHAGATKG